MFISKLYYNIVRVIFTAVQLCFVQCLADCNRRSEYNMIMRPAPTTSQNDEFDSQKKKLFRISKYKNLLHQEPVGAASVREGFYLDRTQQPRR